MEGSWHISGADHQKVDCSTDVDSPRDSFLDVDSKLKGLLERHLPIFALFGIAPTLRPAFTLDPDALTLVFLKHLRHEHIRLFVQISLVLKLDAARSVTFRFLFCFHHVHNSLSLPHFGIGTALRLATAYLDSVVECSFFDFLSSMVVVALAWKRNFVVVDLKVLALGCVIKFFIPYVFASTHDAVGLLVVGEFDVVIGHPSVLKIRGLLLHEMSHLEEEVAHVNFCEGVATASFYHVKD